MLLTVGKVGAAPALLPQADAATPGATGTGFGALMQARRAAPSLAAHPLAELGLRLSARHQDLFTNGVVQAFEKTSQTRTPAQRVLGAFEVLDATMNQSSQMGLVSMLSKVVSKNVETLTTRMS
jgi:hypothetical protein